MLIIDTGAGSETASLHRESLPSTEKEGGEFQLQLHKHCSLMHTQYISLCCWCDLKPLFAASLMNLSELFFFASLQFAKISSIIGHI